MSNNVNESPKHFMVLDAIATGLGNINKISNSIKIDKAEAELIVNDLISQRLVINIEKKGFFGRKKLELGITYIGQRLLDAKKAELEKQAEQIQQWYNNGNTAQLQGYIDNNRMWMPMMLFSGILDMMFFTSMMSMMGMALSPFETGFVGNNIDGIVADGASSGVEGRGGEDNTGSAHDDNSSGIDSGGFGADNFGGGDISF